MYSTCLFCNEDLGRNDVVEFLPIGRRLAFDRARGRLWVVCTRCERWNLTPFETRWEAIEMCERLFSEERKRITTDNIGLAKLDEGLELVRIGQPLEEEFAAWRYGDQFGRRRRRAVVEGVALAGAAGAALAGAVASGAIAGVAIAAYHIWHQKLRRRRSGRVIACVPAENETVAVTGRDLSGIRLKTDLSCDHRWKLVLAHQSGSTTLSGDLAVNALGMIMPTINGMGGSTARVHRALKRLEAVQRADHFLQSAAAMSSHSSRPGSLGTLQELPVDIRLAIEIAVNEQNERHMLEGEMWLLEFAWEQAELVASIADALVVPAEVERRLRELKARRGDAARNRGESR